MPDSAELYARSSEVGTADLTIPPDRMLWHLGDISDARAYVAEQLRLAQSQERPSESTILAYSRSLERLDRTRREKSIELTLEEALRIALANNYQIEAQSYGPAIETARIVQAESAFDSVFFASVISNQVDRPSASQLSATTLETVVVSTGVQKLLPTGATVGVSWQMQRNETNLVFQTLNPEYTSNYDVEVRQPFLQGFGLDYNRSLIRIAQNDRRISNLEFNAQVRDILRSVEERYWRLVQARRNVVISGRLFTEFEQIYDTLRARSVFDSTPVQIAAVLANLETSRAEFIQVLANLDDARDQLVSVLNGPNVHLAEDSEIIPVDFMPIARVVVDPISEVQAALDYRPEIKQQELRVESARIQLGRSKNQELPRLDATFRSTVNGLDSTADAAFDMVTQHDFIEYFVGVEFQVPIGNRGPRALTRQAQLLQSQARAALKVVIERTILEVNTAVRRLETSYAQIGPNFSSAEAREREVESLVARAERRDINTLNSELAARQSLASARRAMLEALVDYQVAIINLEWAKGTLPQYNSVIIDTEAEQATQPVEAMIGDSQRP
jgi:outer membrane protein TolC